MNQHGAVDIDRRVAAYRQTGYERYDPNAPAYKFDEAVREREQYRDVEGRKSIPVVEEELQIGKRMVRRGGVRVYSRVVEQPVEENVTLREEHVHVERRPVNRPAEAGEAGRLREQSIEVTEMAEEPVVQKRARVREEVLVGKETKQRTEKVRDTVRRTEVEVEPLNKDSDSPTSSAAITIPATRIREYLTRRCGRLTTMATASPATGATRAAAGPT